MDDDWEAVADQDLVIHPKSAKTKNANKWEGEDDDDDVKDSWEDEEEKKDEEKPEAKVPVAKPKPNKALKAKMAAEDRLAKEEEEKRLANMTPEEKLAEKLRLQKIQEESDLKTALDTFGVSGCSGLDSFNPVSKEDFKEFGAALSWKLTQYKDSSYFPQFIEDLVRSICAPLPTSEIKKIKITVENLHSEKLKLEKQNAKKPAGKGKAKATLRTENDDIDGYQKYGNDYAEDYDDFM